MRNKKGIIWAWIAVLCILLLFLAYKMDIRDTDGLKRVMKLLGSWAPEVFLLLCAIRSFLLLPCGLFAAVAGVLFGPALGGVLALVGFTFNAVVMYYMAELLGQNWVKKHFAHKVESLDRFINKNSFVNIFLLRLIPLLPFDAVSCMGGIAKTRVDSFIWGTLIGSIPGVFIYTYFGFSLKTMSVPKLIFSACFMGLFAMVPLLYKLYIYKKKCKEDKIKAI